MDIRERQQPQNARFWEWINGDWVKLTLEPGQTLEWGAGSGDEEGWHAHGSQWSLCAGLVLVAAWTDGADCDGRFSTETKYTCDVEYLRYRADAPKVPMWENVECSQRDYAAEAMGY